MQFNAAAADAIRQLLGDPIESAAPADRPDLHGDLPGLPAALGRAFAKIHAIPVPTGAEPAGVGDAIAARLQNGEIDSASLPEPYNRYEAKRLVEIWKDATLPESYTAAPVVCIGEVGLDRIQLAGGEVCAITGDIGVVVDRHLDLAIMQYRIHDTLGAEAVFGFYEAYGSDPNIVALDHYLLSALLLGWLP